MNKTVTRTCYNKSKNLPELIVCSAWKLIDTEDNNKTYIVVGVRHNDDFMRNQINEYDKVSKSPLLDEEQGFITNYGRFVDRKEALAIAKANNQIINDIGYKPDELYSEMLY